MDLELQAKLFRRYPKFYRKPGQRLISQPELVRCDIVGSDGLLSFQVAPEKPSDFQEHLEDDTAPLDYWGIECDGGWFQIIDRLSRDCENEIELLILDDVPKQRWPRAAQIKEKWGGLRFYIRGDVSPALRARIRDVEKTESYETCERCGKPGELRKTGWVHTYCDTCETNYQARKKTASDWSMDKFEQRRAEVLKLLESRAE